MSNTAQDQTKVRYFFLFFVRNLGGSHFLSLRAVSRKNIYAAILLYLVSCIPFMLSLLYLERRYRRILSMARQPMTLDQQKKKKNIYGFAVENSRRVAATAANADASCSWAKATASWPRDQWPQTSKQGLTRRATLSQTIEVSR